MPTRVKKETSTDVANNSTGAVKSETNKTEKKRKIKVEDEAAAPSKSNDASLNTVTPVKVADEKDPKKKKKKQKQNNSQPSIASFFIKNTSESKGGSSKLSAFAASFVAQKKKADSETKKPADVKTDSTAKKKLKSKTASKKKVKKCVSNEDEEEDDEEMALPEIMPQPKILSSATGGDGCSSIVEVVESSHPKVVDSKSLAGSEDEPVDVDDDLDPSGEVIEISQDNKELVKIETSSVDDLKTDNKSTATIPIVSTVDHHDGSNSTPDVSDASKQVHEQGTSSSQVLDESTASIYNIQLSQYLGKEKEVYDKISSLENECEELVSYVTDQKHSEALPFEVKLSMIVQGSNLTLTSLVDRARELLNEGSDDDVSLLQKHGIETVSLADQIKLIAERKVYASEAVNLQGDSYESESGIFHWELVSTECIEGKALSAIKQKRASRRKVSNHLSNIQKLIGLLQQALKGESSKGKSRSKKSLSERINDLNDRCIKFEREEARVHAKEREKELKKQERLNAEKEKSAKKAEIEVQKLKERKDKELQKKREREQKLEEKKKLMDEKERKKLEEKAKNEAEKEKKAQEVKKKVLKAEKQKRQFMSFFNNKPAATLEEDGLEVVEDDKPILVDSPPKAATVMNVLKFVNRENGITSLAYNSKKRSFKKRSKRINVYADIVVVDESANAGFGESNSYVERRMIRVNNRYTMLKFSEDIRPHHWFTCSKRSKETLHPRNPARKLSNIDYENDSEAEWDPEDCADDGEDIEDDARSNDEEEGENNEKYDWEDGWIEKDCIDDEEMLDLTDNKPKLSEDDVQPVIIAPIMGGRPCLDENFADFECHILQSDKNLLSNPFYKEKRKNKESTEDNKKSSSQPSSKQPHTISREGYIAFIEFIHGNSDCKSKDMIVDCFLESHDTVFKSRAQALRVLDRFAEKKRVNVEKNKKVLYWEVNAQVLKQYGMEALSSKIKALVTPDVVPTTPSQNSKGDLHQSTTMKQKKNTTSALKKSSVTKSASMKTVSFESTKLQQSGGHAAPKGVGANVTPTPMKDVSSSSSRKNEKKRIRPTPLASASLFESFVLKKAKITNNEKK